MPSDFWYMLDLMRGEWFLYHVLPYHVGLVVAIIATLYYVYKDEQ